MSPFDPGSWTHPYRNINSIAFLEETKEAIGTRVKIKYVRRTKQHISKLL